MGLEIHMCAWGKDRSASQPGNGNMGVGAMKSTSLFYVVCDMYLLNRPDVNQSLTYSV